MSERTPETFSGSTAPHGDIGQVAMDGVLRTPGSVQRSAETPQEATNFPEEEPVMLHDPAIAEVTEGGHAIPASNPLDDNSLIYGVENKRLDPPPADFLG